MVSDNQNEIVVFDDLVGSVTNSESPKSSVERPESLKSDIEIESELYGEGKPYRQIIRARIDHDPSD